MSIVESNIKFKIVSIEKERSIDGYTTIEAMPVMEFYEGDTIQIRLKTKYAEDRQRIRKMLIEEYYSMARVMEKKPLQIREGDLI